MTLQLPPIDKVEKEGGYIVLSPAPSAVLKEEQEKPPAAKRTAKQTTPACEVKVNLPPWTADGSQSSLFHLSMPAGAVIYDLRQELGEYLPRFAGIFACGDDAEPRQRLKDSDPVPAQVALKEFVGRLWPEMFLTRGQVREAQEMMIKQIQEPAMTQRSLDLEEETKAQEALHRTLSGKSS